MPWYIYSILASLSFVGMVLCTRYLGNKGFSSKQILLFLFGFAFFGFVISNIGSFAVWTSGQSLIFLLILIIAAILSAIGNWADFTAVIKAPNPGFAGVIKSSNVLLVAIFSVLIFGSSLSLAKLLGILLVIGGIALVIIEKNNVITESEKSSSGWKVMAGISALSFGLEVLCIKKAIQLGLSAAQINLFIFGFNFLAFVILTRKEVKNYFKDKIKLKIFLPIVLLAAAFSFIANIFNVKGLAIAPNPGYNESIKNTQILFSTLLSVPLFGAMLNKQKLFGVIVALIGVIILVI